jgi:hypothetical protein
MSATGARIAPDHTGRGRTSHCTLVQERLVEVLSATTKVGTCDRESLGFGPSMATG